MVRSLQFPALAAQLGVGLSALGTVVLAWAVWRRRSEVVDVRDGRRQLTLTQAEDLDNAVFAGAGLSIVAFVVASGFFIWWFHRAYRNLATVRNVEYRTGWAIGSWFVPILNLLRPAQIANEIGTHSPHPSLNRPPLVISWWWALLMVNIAAAFFIRVDTDTLDGLIRADTVSLVTLSVRLVDAGFAIATIRTITAAQRVRFGQLAA